jgi:pSer/pThr/pTyr-binding forkhead associated (FHA) protein
MQHRRDLSLSHPALIPIAGNYDKKPRSLDRDVTTIGRARGSDLCLEANEISVLHCIIYRTADGYRVRDCNSRCGTRVNGESVKTHLLHDTDIINLGPFSFEFCFPKTAPSWTPSRLNISSARVANWRSWHSSCAIASRVGRRANRNGRKKPTCSRTKSAATINA